MKVALIGDTHLSELNNLPQDRALDWALEELKNIKPDIILWLGDITACGSPVAAMRFDEKIKSIPFVSAVVPGNSDIRTPNTVPIVESFLFTHRKGIKIDDVLFVGFNAARDKILPGERERLNSMPTDCNIFLYSHQHPEALDDDSRNFLIHWIKQRNVIMWAHGHIHCHREILFEGVPTLSVIAMDPDKCVTGSPEIVEVTIEGNSINTTSHFYTTDMPESWTEAEINEFSDFLGITCYDIERDMKYAIEEGIKNLEWRAITDTTLPLLEKWRKSGGKTFSLHLPSIEIGGQPVPRTEEFKNSVLDAVRANADMVTVHPPYILNKMMHCDNSAFDMLADVTAEALLPAAEAGIDILVENNHTQFGNPSDIFETPYGCSPLAQVGWRNALNERLGVNKCSLRFDIGHARNNMPLSQEYPIGKWYALLGNQIHSYHLHQTTCTPQGKMSNHHSITGWHDGFISFDGFLGAWHNKQISHAPIILEIREGDGIPAIETWRKLQELIKEKI